ncbi:MAG: hypothetical protein QM691_05745 [Opitutaceae bacterium]
MHTKLLSLVFALGAVLCTTGCDTVGEPLAERLSRPPVKRSFEAPEAKVFTAAVASLREMGYAIRSTKAKSGTIEAYGRLGIDDSFRSSNQHNCRVTIAALPDGSVEVQFEVREQVEERTTAGGYRQSEQVLPFGGIHQRFFDELQSRL